MRCPATGIPVGIPQGEGIHLFTSVAVFFHSGLARHADPSPEGVGFTDLLSGTLKHDDDCLPV
jgi:hypothetical protein